MGGDGVEWSWWALTAGTNPFNHCQWVHGAPAVYPKDYSRCTHVGEESRSVEAKEDGGGCDLLC